MSTNSFETDAAILTRIAASIAAPHDQALCNVALRMGKLKPMRPLVEEAIKQLEADTHFYLASELKEALERSGL
jgi:hypothetical protein